MIFEIKNRRAQDISNQLSNYEIINLFVLFPSYCIIISNNNLYMVYIVFGNIIQYIIWLLEFH